MDNLGLFEVFTGVIPEANLIMKYLEQNDIKVYANNKIDKTNYAGLQLPDNENDAVLLVDAVNLEKAVKLVDAYFESRDTQ